MPVIDPLPPAPLRSNPDTFSDDTERFLAALSPFAEQLSEVSTLAQLTTTTTSTTSNSIGTGSRTFTVPTELGFATGMSLRIANSGTNFMTADVVSYSGTSLVVNSTTTSGSGTFASWTISQAAVGANSAASVSNVPAGNISATNVQAAINELDTEKLSASAGAVTDTNLNNVITGGTIGDAVNIPVITYNSKGRITAVNVASLPALGVGQTWQNVTASRAFATTYTNSTGKPIEVQVQGSLNAGSIYSVTIDGAIRNSFGAPALNNQCPTSFVVPNGATYSVAVTAGAGSLQLWNELR